MTESSNLVVNSDPFIAREAQSTKKNATLAIGITLVIIGIAALVFSHYIPQISGINASISSVLFDGTRWGGIAALGTGALLFTVCMWLKRNSLKHLESGQETVKGASSPPLKEKSVEAGGEIESTGSEVSEVTVPSEKDVSVSKRASTPVDDVVPQAIIDNLTAWLEKVKSQEKLQGYETARDRILDAYRTKSEYLDLGNLGLRSLPEAIGCLTDLYGLNLSHNKLNAIPEELGNLAGLSQLDVSYNRLRSFLRDFSKFKNIEELNLSNNSLRILPDGLCELTNIRYLNISRNKLDKLPINFHKLNNIIMLYLNNNKFAVFPEVILNLSQLVVLDLSSNQLNTLPLNIYLLTEVTDLNLMENTIRFENWPASMKKLKRLNLSLNKITELPISLTKLRIHELYICGNPLTLTSEKAFEEARNDRFPLEVNQHDTADLRVILSEYDELFGRSTKQPLHRLGFFDTFIEHKNQKDFRTFFCILDQTWQKDPEKSFEERQEAQEIPLVMGILERAVAEPHFLEKLASIVDGLSNRYRAADCTAEFLEAKNSHIRELFERMLALQEESA